jgi:hypothetical protein
MGALLELLPDLTRARLMPFSEKRWVCHDALDTVTRYDVSEVIIEMDNQRVVNIVKKKARINKPWGVIVNQCVSFLGANPNSSISWVSRVGNRVTHELAKWAEFDTIRY